MPPKSTLVESGETPKLYKIEEAAVLLRISRAKLYRLINEGRITPVKEGRSTFITPAVMDAYVKRLETEAEIRGESDMVLSIGITANSVVMPMVSETISSTTKGKGE